MNISSFQGMDLMPTTCRAELDSHADTCGVNNTAIIISYTGKVAHVSAYSPDLEVLRDIPIVKAAMAYDDAVTGETYVIMLNQALYFGYHTFLLPRTNYEQMMLKYMMLQNI